MVRLKKAPVVKSKESISPSRGSDCSAERLEPLYLTFKYVVIEEGWLKKNGIVYRYWRIRGEKKWRKQITPYKDIPIVTNPFPLVDLRKAN